MPQREYSYEFFNDGNKSWKVLGEAIFIQRVEAVLSQNKTMCIVVYDYVPFDFFHVDSKF